jgi:HAE1 family hydrophobic/amphiphilic exporter-1
MWIADLSIRRPVMTIMFVGALVLLGAISLPRINMSLFPHVDIPIVTVETTLDGASPATIETEVTDRLEEELFAIGGLDSLRSVSADGYSQIILEFELEEDVNLKSQEVRDKAARALPFLPEGTKQPLVTILDPDSEPIVSIILSGPLPPGELTKVAKNTVKERLQRVPGVGSVQLVGGREREVRVWLNASRMRGYGISVDEISSAIRREHVDIAGGRLEYQGGSSEFTVKTLGEVMSLEELKNITISRSDLSLVRLRDVARVEDGLEDERSYAELNRITGISLEIRKQSGANTVNVARAVSKELEKIQTELPSDISLTPVRDNSRFIESTVRDVSFDIILGIVLVVVVTLFFLLDIRATIIVATAIPTALIPTFFVLYVLDFSLNMMSLIAISLCVGLLVDDALVVLESIYKEIEEGQEPAAAASNGTRKVASAVVASTFAVMAVFLPISFTQGLIGVFMYQYGVTVAVAVGISLIVSLTLTPMLCSRLLKRSIKKSSVFHVVETAHSNLEARYAAAVQAALSARWLVLIVAAMAVAAGVYYAGKVPLSFTAKTDRSEFLATVELPLGTGVAESKRLASELSATIKEFEHVQLVLAVIGSGAQVKTNEIGFYVGLTPKQERSIHQNVIMDEVRIGLTKAVPQAKHVTMTQVPWISGGGFFGSDIDMALSGPDLDKLQLYAERITQAMQESGKFRDIKSSYESGKPEIQVSIDRDRAATLGIPVHSIASAISATMGGKDVASYEEHGDRYDIRLRYDKEYRDHIGTFDLIQFRSSDGSLVDFRSIADVSITDGPVQIDRYNRARKISVSGNAPAGIATGELLEEMDKILANMDLEPAYHTTYLGASEQVREIANSLLFAFMLALLILYMILASQFESFVQPIAIMLTAPLSFVGAFTFLALTNSELSATTQIAMVALMGLVMKNGILLVDQANQSMSRGLAAKEAMIESAQLRLRPVLMTAFTTIFGMIPTALATSDGAELRTSTGIIVIGGLGSSTLLTLFVVPVVYTLIADAKAGLNHLHTHFQLGRNK